MSREYKKYGIRATRKPTTQQGKLASTVQVLDEKNRRGYCYVNFEMPLLICVGKALPKGISERNPAFLRVEYSSTLQQWIVAAEYLDESYTAVLWKTTDKPSWLHCYTTKSTKDTTDA